MSGKGRIPSGLSPEDRVLWEEIKRTIRPLPARKTAIPAADQAAEAPPSRQEMPPKRTARGAAQPKPNASPPLATLDRRMRSRVARGRVEIDAKLDLHGLTLERARPRLAGFLASAQARGFGLVLVITGKGGADRREGERGALRREVPHWLSLPEFRPFVIGFEQAVQVHGGAGALYVRIRRRRN